MNRTVYPTITRRYHRQVLDDSQTRLKGLDEHEVEDQRNDSVSDIGSFNLSADSEDYDVDEGSIVLTGLDCGIDRDRMTISEEDLCREDSITDAGSIYVSEFSQGSRTKMDSICTAEGCGGDQPLIDHDGVVVPIHFEEEDRVTLAVPRNDDNAGYISNMYDSEGEVRGNGGFDKQYTTTDCGNLHLLEEDELDSPRGSVFEFFSKIRAANDAKEGKEEEDEK